jgi:adenine-specific DNA-methyltransferase
MNSLLEYEGMGGQVQMIYFDPPYGVKFGSNFQPFVRKNNVKHGPDDEMIREPEMVRAYRDTWELGLHSYLTYMRDRALLAKELLSDSGSIFIQISDENLHHVREVMDEVFGAENFLVTVFVRKKGSQRGNEIRPINDYLLWYCKNKSHSKIRFLYHSKLEAEDLAEEFEYYESAQGDCGSTGSLSSEDLLHLVNNGGKLYVAEPLTSGGEYRTQMYPVHYKGQVFRPPANNCWKFNEEGMSRIAASGRLHIGKNQIRFKKYHTDFPFRALNNLWDDFAGARNRLYVVQTAVGVVERCLLMTTDPGDLALDITCGSGTTAYVAEQWGRRWISCDTSRVPLALARQRLLTATFPWYQLRQPSLGPAGNFVFECRQKRGGEQVGGLVPRITSTTIANDLSPDTVTLVDRPEVNRHVTRVCGPFTVEATIQATMMLEEEDSQVAATPGVNTSSPRAYLDRMIEVLRQSKTLQLPGNVSLELEAVCPLADRECLHAEAIAKNGSERRIAIAFGPEDGAIGSEYVFNAQTEALQQGFHQLFLFGFAIQAKAREMLDKLKIPTTYIAVTPDVVMSDLLKTSKSSQIFSITGLPDVVLKPAGNKQDGTSLHQVEVKGLDIFRPDTMETDSIEAENLPCWMLDTNYNGMVFCASQVFFPKTGAWDNLQKSLKGEFSDSVWEHLAGITSEPFVLGDKRRIAVKVIDDRGNELMVVKNAEGAT